MPRCNHPHEARKPQDDGLTWCGKCEKAFLPHAEQARHGTPSGWAKHKLLKQEHGEWSWPPCRPCGRARREYLSEYGERPHVVSGRRLRSMARNRALQRLKVAYAQEFARINAEELALLEQGQAAIRVLDARADAVLAALPYPATTTLAGRERDLRLAVKGRWATPAEVTAWGQVESLRQQAREIREKEQASDGQ